MEKKIALISAEWHSDIVGVAESTCKSELMKFGIAPESIDEFSVPGSLELPLTAQKLANTGKYTAIVAFGFVVDGGIYRHDFVGRAIIEGFVRVGLDTGIPVLSCVLTPHNFHEHSEHVEYFKKHMIAKGTEAANACYKFVNVLNSIK